VLARQGLALGLLLAPGVLFSPPHAPSNMLRVPVSMPDHPEAWGRFVQALQMQPRDASPR
jgi:hypothetical protein